jgi:carbohydrate diacid regulator
MQDEMSPPDVGTLSPRLRRVIGELRADSPSLSIRMLDALRRSIPEYRTLSTSVAQDVYRVGVKNAELWYDALLIGDKPSDDDLRWIGRFSQRRHSQEVSLVAVLQAYRIGARVYLDALLSHVGAHKMLSTEVLFHVSPFLLYYNDLLGRTVSDAYFIDRSDVLGSNELLHARLCAAVFDPTEAGATAFDAAAGELGIDTGWPHVGVALKLASVSGKFAPHVPERITDLIAAEGLRDGVPTSMTLHRGHLLLWLPANLGEAHDECERRLASHAMHLLKQCPYAIAAGVGARSVGAAGWRSSAEQAITSIELGRRLRPRDSVYRYSEFAFDSLVRQSHEMSTIFEEMIARISTEGPLLETLEAYFEHRQSHKAAAAALGIHRNTLVHRLDRIETLLGAPLDDMALVSRLYLALRQRKLMRDAPPAH